jgi:hypothetical protein
MVLRLGNFIENAFTSALRPKGQLPPKKGETEVMAIRPLMTLQVLEGIRRQVRLNPLAGKGAYTVEQLENDAILAHYNTVVAVDNEEQRIKDAKDTLTLTTPAPAGK